MRRLGMTITILYSFLIFTALGIALVLAFGLLERWTLYNGVIAAYLAMGTILIVERIYRECPFPGHDTSRVGAWLGRFLPRASGS
jgi:uncharacterized membrane protein